MKRVVVGVAIGASLWGAPLGAQNSVFAVVGLGFPGRPVSVPARALGSGTMAFDPLSAVNPAAVGGIGQLTAMVSWGATYRSFRAGDTEAGDLQETRFPLALLAGTVPNTPLKFAASFATFAERTFEFTTSDTVVLRGLPVEVTDRIGSDGAVVDARGALGWQLSPRLSVGLAAHVITGSARLTANREFSDSAYLAIDQRSELEFSAYGLSGGFVWAPRAGLRVAAAVRRDTRLDERVDSVVTRSAELPTVVTAGFMVAPTPALRWTVSASWRGWSSAADDLAAVGAQAFDTWEVGSGIQIGGRDIGVATLPFRVGVRYAQLPFSPAAERPREIDIAVGTSLPFARNRAVIDITVERILRDGAGMTERAWNAAFALIVRP